MKYIDDMSLEERRRFNTEVNDKHFKYKASKGRINRLHEVSLKVRNRWIFDMESSMIPPSHRPDEYKPTFAHKEGARELYRTLYSMRVDKVISVKPLRTTLNPDLDIEVNPLQYDEFEDERPDKRTPHGKDYDDKLDAETMAQINNAVAKALNKRGFG